MIIAPGPQRESLVKSIESCSNPTLKAGHPTVSEAASIGTLFKIQSVLHRVHASPFELEIWLKL